MASDQDHAPRSNLAMIVATAAVTVAIGVTLAGLSGYLTPRRDIASQEPAAVVEPAPPPAQTQALQPRAPAEVAPLGPAGPSVVLVPVTPDPRAQPAAPPPAPELLLAMDPPLPAADGPAYQGDDDDDDDDDDDHRDRERRRHHEHEDDDDDD